MTQNIAHDEHYDPEGSKIGMWIFIFTELFLFGGLFLVYAVFRAKYSQDFHIAAEELNTFIGTLNTVVLLVSSMTATMSITAIQKSDYKKAVSLVALSISCIAAGGGLLIVTGWIPLLLGLLNIFFYNVLYTNLKRITVFAILPGGLVGAVPPVIG